MALALLAAVAGKVLTRQTGYDAPTSKSLLDTCRKAQYSLTSISGADRDTALRQARRLIGIAESDLHPTS